LRTATIASTIFAASAARQIGLDPPMANIVSLLRWAFGSQVHRVNSFRALTQVKAREADLPISDILPARSVARKYDAHRRVRAADLKFHRGEAKQMACVPETDAKAFCNRGPFTVWQGSKQGHAGGCVPLIVDRLDRRPAALRVAAVEIVHFHFLDMGRIRQHHGAYVDCRTAREYWPTEALLDELRQKATVVNMRVGQDDGVDRIRRKWECAVVEFPLGFGALEYATVDQNLPMGRFCPGGSG
jgi:hypothetical protein